MSVSDMKEARSELRKRLDVTFNDDALERLARSNQAYYTTHGEYVPQLALLLAMERTERFAALARVDSLQAELVRARAAIEHDCADAYRRGFEAGEAAWIDGYAEKPQ